MKYLIIIVAFIMQFGAVNANVISYNPSTGTYVLDQYGCKSKEMKKPKKKEKGADGVEIPKEPKGRNGTLPVGVKLDF